MCCSGTSVILYSAVVQLSSYVLQWCKCHLMCCSGANVILCAAVVQVSSLVLHWCECPLMCYIDVNALLCAAVVPVSSYVLQWCECHLMCCSFASVILCAAVVRVSSCVLQCWECHDMICNGASVILCVAVVRVSLFIQNFSVMLCAVAVYFTLVYREQYASLFGGLLPQLCEGVIIFLAVIAQLASVAYKIAIEKDWIVVVAAGNNAKLASKLMLSDGPCEFYFKDISTIWFFASLVLE